MGQWISSKEFAKIIGISDRAVRARAMQKNLHFNTKYYSYSYTEAEAEAFIMAYRVDMLEKAVKQSKLNTELARLERAVKRSRIDCLNSLDYLVLPRHDKAVQHDRIESSNIKDIQQNKVSSDNTQSKDIESSIASINTKLDTTMGGVVDFNTGVCNNNKIITDEPNGISS